LVGGIGESCCSRIERALRSVLDVLDALEQVAVAESRRWRRKLVCQPACEVELLAPMRQYTPDVAGTGEAALASTPRFRRRHTFTVRMPAVAYSSVQRTWRVLATSTARGAITAREASTIAKNSSFFGMAGVGIVVVASRQGADARLIEGSMQLRLTQEGGAISGTLARVP
jgi:hypothetical protein